MVAIRVTYLMGRVYSSILQDGDSKVEVEWPPHPSRLFSSMVSAWGDGGAEEELRPALAWIERQNPPVVYADEISRRKSVQVFVPINDSAKLPENRSRKPRAFPSATLANPDVYFVWDNDPPGEVLAGLRTILRRTSSLGHSASLVTMELSDPPASEQNAWHPDPVGDMRMRIAYGGRLEELTSRYAMFRQTPEKIFRPTAGESCLYSRLSPAREPPAQGLFDQMIVIRRFQGPRTSLRSTLSLTTALRGAVQAHSPQPVPEYISGHARGSTQEKPVRSESPHLAFVALPVVDFRYSAGEVMGLAVLLPAALTREERAVCWATVGEVQSLTTPWGRWEVELADAEERRKALREKTWTAPGKLWSTVTPFVFDRFPKDPYGPEAEQVVRDAFERAGLPAPVAIDLHYNPWHTGVPKASVFPPAPARRGKPQRYHCHVRVEFDREVAGPMIAGAGRYYGYGLFRRHTKEEG